MEHFDWDRSKEDLLTETRLSLSDIFEGSDYTIVRNPTVGEIMNNIYLCGYSKRLAFLVPVKRKQCFTLAFKIEYLPAVQNSGAKLGELKEIKKGKYPNWRQYEDISYEDLRWMLSAFVCHR